MLPLPAKPSFVGATKKSWKHRDMSTISTWRDEVKRAGFSAGHTARKLWSGELLHATIANKQVAGVVVKCGGPPERSGWISVVLQRRAEARAGADKKGCDIAVAGEHFVGQKTKWVIEEVARGAIGKVGMHITASGVASEIARGLAGVGGTEENFWRDQFIRHPGEVIPDI